MNDLLNSQSKKAPERAHGSFDVQQIPIEKIVPSQSNKYGIRDIEEMAASIEAMGLLHNLVVRVVPDSGIYELVSGERRYMGMKLLHDEGKAGYDTVPCKVESGRSEAFTELELIFANSTARELTDYEKTYQSARVKALLQELKQSGHPFTGRMRDIAADVLGVSPAQMGRMESISKNLAPEFTEEFKAELIGVSVAYELSTLPPKEQAKAFDTYKGTGTIAPKEIKEKRERVKPTAATPIVPVSPPVVVSERPAAQLTPTAQEAPQTPLQQTEQPYKALQPKRDATIRDLYTAAHDLGEWGDARADSIAETCRAAASLLESEV